MLYHWLYPYAQDWALFNVFRYVTFRTFGAFFCGLIFYFLFSAPFMRWIKAKQFGQVVRTDGPATHHKKRNTPTLGGLLITACTVASTLLWTDLTEPFIWICLFVLVGFSAIGLADDYRKIILKNPQGLRGKYKLVLETIVALASCAALYTTGLMDTNLSFPFLKDFQPDLGLGYLFFGSLVLVSTANAVNLTDGLDGLVTVPAIASFLSYSVLCYAAGHSLMAEYLQVPFVLGASEVSIVCGSIMGALMGFLWFNTHPAEIFMGDVGSLGIGGLLGTVALISKNEILLLLIGGIFVLETVSVMAQVASFKLTGKRVFKMAPLHHHFEIKGWHESKVIVRFWMISFILALLALSTLKLR